MTKKYTITKFIEVAEPITAPITKFGGQPFWLTESQWPLSRSLNEPMLFVCQISLDPEIFGDISGKMAYLFITDDYAIDVVAMSMPAIWDENEGENAIIIQPGGELFVETQPLSNGPSIYTTERNGSPSPPIKRREYAVELQAGEDAEFSDEYYQRRDNGIDEDCGMGFNENKIGGTPLFLQIPQFPDNNNEDWKLLLQIDSVTELFNLNFGDGGIGYAFISTDGESGKFLWQCT